MALSERKKVILQAVVDSYITSCEPISSSEIKENHLPALSGATIRNELAALEEMGYLVQPHTSAGRIPTAEAYRLYVEKLMPRRKLTRPELKTVRRYFNNKITELDDMLKSTAKLISEVTNLTGVVYVEAGKSAVISSIKIVKLTDTAAMVIIVTDRGVLKDTMVTTELNLSEQYYINASQFISSVFSGHTIEEIARPQKIIAEVKREYRHIFNTVLKILKDYAYDETPGDIVLEGSAKLLDQPEYANLPKAKAMLELLEAKEELVPILKNNDNVQLSIKIGKDNELKEGMPECAIVTANYSVNGVNIGNASVIGPMRMDYSKVVSVLDYIGKTLNNLPTNEEYADTDIDDIKEVEDFGEYHDTKNE